MKYFILILLTTINVEAKYYTFFYPKVDLKIGVKDENYNDAFKKAAKVCFKILTKDKYENEEKGLDIIDICANGRILETKETL